MQEMNYEEFKKKYMEPNKRFDFTKFKIVCKSCGSEKVEFGGEMEDDWSGVYYENEQPSHRFSIVCKCHDCGNAFNMQEDYYTPVERNR